MDQIKMSKSSPSQKDSPNPQYPTTMLPTKSRYPPLDVGHSTKLCGMWTLKHEIRSPKLYELLVNTELKVDTSLDLKNFYNHIEMCINTVNRLREELLPAYQYIKIYYEFE